MMSQTACSYFWWLLENGVIGPVFTVETSSGWPFLSPLPLGGRCPLEPAPAPSVLGMSALAIWRGCLHIILSHLHVQTQSSCEQRRTDTGWEDLNVGGALDIVHGFSTEKFLFLFRTPYFDIISSPCHKYGTQYIPHLRPETDFRPANIFD